MLLPITLSLTTTLPLLVLQQHHCPNHQWHTPSSRQIINSSPVSTYRSTFLPPPAFFARAFSANSLRPSSALRNISSIPLRNRVHLSHNPSSLLMAVLCKILQPSSQSSSEHLAGYLMCLTIGSLIGFATGSSTGSLTTVIIWQGIGASCCRNVVLRPALWLFHARLRAAMGRLMVMVT
ncbi:hypothetical protein CONLIGDRAFT_517717 [Coniochaeta ligniaria NRRL 30616]|uniref:Uncharacterized protein n=1 Tax=Coniochaeta ligniaria NRRL 30616 TaxID=1408157 RepID=A0A1J7IEH1_9PEZI|nr:hypothetical protein CONLIGDRAFT_517717 [Coniochaeta ligniaria NRRL 30616]